MTSMFSPNPKAALLAHPNVAAPKFTAPKVAHALISFAHTPQHCNRPVQLPRAAQNELRPPLRASGSSHERAPAVRASSKHSACAAQNPRARGSASAGRRQRRLRASARGAPRLPQRPLRKR